MVGHNQMVNSVIVTLACYIFKPDFESKLYGSFSVVVLDKFLRFPVFWFSHLSEQGSGSQ